MRMRYARIFSLAVLALVFVSCRQVEFEDGRIPREYLEEVARYAGNYRGSFLEQNGTLKFRLDGNYAYLEFRGDTGYDILMGCEAYVGEIRKAKFDGSCFGPTKGLESVTFSFYPGHCADVVVGREFVVDLTASGGEFRWDASVLKERGQSGPVYFRGAFFGPR